MENLRERLQIPAERLDDLNAVLLQPGLRVIDDLLEVVARYGTPEEINRRAAAALQLPALRAQVAAIRPEYLADLDWLEVQRDTHAFTPMAAFRRRVLGDQAEAMTFADDYAVTLEISACQYFPWVRAVAERALQRGDLVPGRFIRVRKMKEQEQDGDLPCHAGRDADHRRERGRYARHQGHGRVKCASGRARDNHRLLRRRRSAG